MTNLGEYGSENLDFLGNRRGVVDPVQLHRGLPDHESQVQLCVYLAETVMRTSSEDQKVLSSLLFGVSGVVSLRVEYIRIGVDVWITGRGIDGRNDHGAYVVS